MTSSPTPMTAAEPRAAGPTTQVDPDEIVDRFDNEKPGRRLGGTIGIAAATACALLGCFALYWVFRPLPVAQYRFAFLAGALALAFILYPARRARGRGPSALDYALALTTLLVLSYAVVDWSDFVRRGVVPTDLDLALGIATIALLLEGCRRCCGWILPVVALGFIAYAYFGSEIPISWEIGHVGFEIERIVGHLYMSIEGIFSSPLAAASTYVVLFCIYGAVLHYSGASQFFIDLSLATFRKSNSGPGKTTALAGFLLGSVSGSGVATTVQLGATTWPLLRRGGYPANEGGAVLAATGIGAILSPPTLGAAAFIIAEFLGISYFNVLVFATVPTFLYYLGIILAIEADARRLKASPVHPDTPPVGYLLRRFGYHFSSLGMIVLFLGLGLSPFRAVVYATVVAFLLSFLSRRDAMTPVRLGQALAEGGRAVVPVAVLCATAGIIVGVVGMTGMGFRLASMIVDVSGDSLALTALASAIAVVFLGLAVPVTASFIISAVIIAPALVAQGVPDYAAYMFVFYYSVLSEVSPPTAISPFAASALTGGDAMRTMWFTWRYSLPAFLVPFAFVLSPNGEGLLLQGPVLWIIISVLCSSVAVAALAVATGGWMLGRARVPERALCAVAGLMLLYLHPLWIGLGLGVFALAVAVHLLWRLTERTTASAVETSR